MSSNQCHSASYRADEGADDSIISAHTTQRAVLNCIRKNSKMSFVTLQVVSNDDLKAKICIPLARRCFQKRCGSLRIDNLKF